MRESKTAAGLPRMGGVPAVLGLLALSFVLLLLSPAAVRGQNNLEISKSAEPDPVDAGQVITYTIVVTNNTGGSLSNVLVTDTVPSKTTYITGSMAYTPTATSVIITQPISVTPGHVMTWAIQSLNDGDKITMTFRVAVASPLISGTQVTNTAWISNSTRLSATATTAVQATPQLTVTKSVTPAAVQPGKTVTYTILITNTGNGIAQGVTVTDTLAEGFSPAQTTWSNRAVTDLLTLTFTATAPVTEGTYTNLVTVTWGVSEAHTGPTAPVIVDGTPPDSQASSPDYDNGGSIAVAWTANDTTSGVAGTRLYVRKEGSTWADSGLPAQSGISGTFSYTPTMGDGTYYFQTVSTDHAGNQETPPSGSTGNGDDQTVYDTTAPSSSNPTIQEFSDYLHSVGTTLYYGDGMSGSASFYLEGQASDVTSGLDTATFSPAFGEGPFTDNTPATWTSGDYGVRSSDSGDGVITVTITDRAENSTYVLFPYIEDTDAPSSTVTSTPDMANAPISIGWQAEDTESGIRQVCLWVKKETTGTWSNTGQCATGTSGTFTYSPTSGDGTYYFQTVATDQVSNVESGPDGNGDGNTLYDTTDPSSTASSPDYDNDGSIAVAWTANDDTSGVAGTRLYVRKEGGTWADSGLPAQSGTSGTFYYTPPDDGTYYFQTVSTDHAGNIETGPADNGDDLTVYDTTDPSSTASSPDYDNGGPIAVTWTANDDTSGVASTRLYVRKEGGTWADSGLPAQNGISGTFYYTPTMGDGTYYFQTVSTDYAGNIETGPADNGDTQTEYDTQAPTSQAWVDVDYTKQSTVTVTWQAIAILTLQGPLSPIEYTRLWVRYEDGDWLSTALTQTGTSGAFIYSFDHGEGAYYFATQAFDKAGNVQEEPAGEGDDLIIYDTTAPTSTAQSPSIFALAGGNIPVTWEANDAGSSGITVSGVSKTCLWYAFENGDWTDSGLPCQPGLSGTFSFTPTEGAGTYYFQTVSTDHAGNTETEPTGNGDTQTYAAHFIYLPTLLRNYVPPAPDLSNSTKTATPDIADAGGEVLYTIELKNTGDAQAAPVSLSDPIPAQTTFVSGSAQGCSYTGGQIVWSGPLGVGESHICSFRVWVNADATGTIVNTATVYDGYHPQPLMLRVNTPVSWQQSGLAGLTVYSLAPCPADPNIVYAGTKANGVYKSSDGGRSWSPTALGREMVWSIAVDPTDCDTAYATTWGRGILKTTDGGGTWSPKNKGLGEMYLYALITKPDDGRVLYAGTNSLGIYKSVDGGENWTAAGLQGLSVDTLMADPDNTQTIYAGTWGNGVYKSTDGGWNWAEINTGLQDLNVYILALDPNAPAVLYAATYTHGIYRSENGGASWTREWPNDRTAYTVAVDAKGIAYAGTDGTSDGAGIWKRDGTWQDMVKQPGPAPIVRSIAFTPDLLLVGTTDGVWWYGPEP